MLGLIFKNASELPPSLPAVQDRFTLLPPGMGLTHSIQLFVPLRNCLAEYSFGILDAACETDEKQHACEGEKR